eukprot:6466331-Ditylum_brightwellii.AAC.1
MLFPARTYNISANHRHNILSSTLGHPAGWNEKTLVLFDDFLCGVKEGRYMSASTFELLEEDKNGEVISVVYVEPWGLADNGYLKWPTAQPPFKLNMNMKERRWSLWIESMRKDVECTFVILKGRFCILKI